MDRTPLLFLILSTALISNACRADTSVSTEERLGIYAAVLAARDTAHGQTRDRLFMDTRVLTPVEIRTDEHRSPAAEPLQPRSLLDSLVARGLIRGICEPVDDAIRGRCVRPVDRPVLSFSAPVRKNGDTVIVSVLYYTVENPSDSLSRMFAFAAEEEFALRPASAGWSVIGKRRTMIT